MESGELIEKKLEELRSLCKFGLNRYTVHISFNLNSEGWSTTIQERTPESLRNDKVTMRNIKGDFIK